MPRPSLAALGLALSAVAAAPAAFAQSSLGLAFGEAGLTVQSSAAGSLPAAQLTADYRITGAHGLQLGVSAADRPDGWVGQIDARLYMEPAHDRKYGFFLALADVDGRSATIGTGGAEVMWSPRPGTVVEGRAGIGLASGSVDFITAAGSVTLAVGDRSAFVAGFGLTEVDEAAFSAVGYTVKLGVHHLMAGSGPELRATLIADGLTGSDSAQAEPRLEIAASWAFGRDRGIRRKVASRSFETIQPLDPMILRGLF